jgi:hypothetical protein
MGFFHFPIKWLEALNMIKINNVQEGGNKQNKNDGCSFHISISSDLHNHGDNNILLKWAREYKLIENFKPYQRRIF